MELRHKTVLIVSPQNWGDLHISKHHYAIELTKQGNTVYFLNLPSRTAPLFRKRRIPSYPGLFVIDYYPIYRGKTVLPKWCFEALMRFQIAFIQSRIKQPIDVVWSFTSKFLYNLNWFSSNALKIYHLVDNEATGNEQSMANSADFIFTVSKKLSSSLGAKAKDAMVINHGIAQYVQRQIQVYHAPDKLTFGYVGNLQNAFVDRLCLLELVRTNPEIQFNFIGPIVKEGNNLQGTFDESFQQFIDELKSLNNCSLKGKIPSDKLYDEIKEYDGFIVTYDPVKLSAVGGNSHKIIEFLHTGRVIVSNFIDEYEGTSLFPMCTDVNSNRGIHTLFSNVVDQIEKYNAQEEQEKRIQFARSNTYSSHLARISKLIQ